MTCFYLLLLNFFSVFLAMSASASMEIVDAHLPVNPVIDGLGIPPREMSAEKDVCDYRRGILESPAE